MKQIEQHVAEIHDEIIEVRRALHRIPEVGFAEYKTAKFVAGYLKDLGLEVQTGVGGQGVVALLKGEQPGKTVGIRACLDALEVEEQTGLDFCSEHEGRMHACGHDGNMAMTLGAAKVLKGYQRDMKGNVKFIFQSSEENTGGAVRVIEEGHLENPHVDIIVTPHNWPGLAESVIGIKPGAVMASSDIFTLDILGKAGHGAWPHLAVDPMPIAADIITALQKIVSREINPIKPALLTIGKIYGGTAVNIIPERITIEGTVRTLDPEVRVFMSKRIAEVANGIAQAARGRCELKYDWVTPPAINDRDLARVVTEILAAADHPLTVTDDILTEMGCEEFALYQEKIPGLFLFIGNDKEGEPFVPIHAPNYDLNENILAAGTKMLCEIALGYQLIPALGCRKQIHPCKYQ